MTSKVTSTSLLHNTHWKKKKNKTKQKVRDGVCFVLSFFFLFRTQREHKEKIKTETGSLCVSTRMNLKRKFCFSQKYYLKIYVHFFQIAKSTKGKLAFILFIFKEIIMTCIIIYKFIYKYQRMGGPMQAFKAGRVAVITGKCTQSM